MIRLLLWENNSMFCIRSRSIISLELGYPGEEQQLDIQSSRQTAYCVSSFKKKKQQKKPAWPKYLLTAWFLPFSQISWFCHIFAVLLNRFPSFAPYLPFLTKHSQKCVTQSFGNHILTLLWGLRGFISMINLTKHIFFPSSTSFDNHMFLEDESFIQHENCFQTVQAARFNRLHVWDLGSAMSPRCHLVLICGVQGWQPQSQAAAAATSTLRTSALIPALQHKHIITHQLCNNNCLATLWGASSSFPNFLLHIRLLWWFLLRAEAEVPSHAVMLLGGLGHISFPMAASEWESPVNTSSSRGSS